MTLSKVRCFLITAQSSVVLENLVIRNGLASSPSTGDGVGGGGGGGGGIGGAEGEGGGGGVAVVDSWVALRGCAVSGCRAASSSSGKGFAMQGSGGFGGGVLVASGALEVDACAFAGNVAENGGALALLVDGALLMAGSTVGPGNSATVL